MKSQKEKIYPTDLTDERWCVISPIPPLPKSGPGKSGRPASDLRTIVNGILYVNKTGRQWRTPPKEFGPWNTVYGYFSRQAKEWVWKEIMDVIRKKERKRQGRKAEPSAGGIDSQSVKSGIQGS
ncbi:transposase [Desulfococcaceae bacterium HSG9]|nr:transposase [Desulfococcaceae bacterium HSG9]